MQWPHSYQSGSYLDLGHSYQPEKLDNLETPYRLEGVVTQDGLEIHYKLRWFIRNYALIAEQQANDQFPHESSYKKPSTIHNTSWPYTVFSGKWVTLSYISRSNHTQLVLPSKLHHAALQLHTARSSTTATQLKHLLTQRAHLLTTSQCTATSTPSFNTRQLTFLKLGSSADLNPIPHIMW